MYNTNHINVLKIGKGQSYEDFFFQRVTHLYLNSFGGDIVLDSFNNAWDEDNVLDQIYVKKICLDFYCDYLDFHKIIRKY